MLVDDELPQDERIQLLAEINRNPEYKKVYEQEMKFKAYIQKNASQQLTIRNAKKINADF